MKDEEVNGEAEFGFGLDEEALAGGEPEVIKTSLTEIEFAVEPDVWLPIEDLLKKFHPQNSQERWEYEKEAIANSIMLYGFTGEPIIVNRWNDKIISGHGRVEVCFERGYRGELPVIYKNLNSEPKHRMAMIGFNNSRGHQDVEKERAEIEALLDSYSKDDVMRALAYRDDQFEAMMGGDVPSLNDLKDEHGEEGERDFWPKIVVQVSPLTFQTFESTMNVIKGADEAEKFEKLLMAVDLTVLD